MRNHFIQIFTILFIIIILMSALDCSRFTKKDSTVNAPKKSNAPIGPFTRNELKLLEDYKDYYTLKSEFLKESEKSIEEISTINNTPPQPPASETKLDTTTDRINPAPFQICTFRPGCI